MQRKYKIISKEKFKKLYINGESMENIAALLENTKKRIVKYFYNEFFEFERLELKKQRYKNLNKTRKDD